MALDQEIKDKFDEEKEERENLSKIRLISFTANPNTIRPFDQATLTWSISVPPDAANIGNLSFTFGGAPVDRVGSKLVSPLKTAAFILEVHGTNLKRHLGSVTVSVEAVDCQEFTLAPLQLRPHAEKLRDRFVGGSISKRGEIITTTGDFGVGATVPLKIAIENFFDAEADVDIILKPSVRSEQAVFKLDSLKIDIIFHLAEHILSLGSAAVAQAVLEPLAEDLIKTFLRTQLESDLAREINNIIPDLLELFKGADPAHRVFKLHDLRTSTAGLTISACPV